MSDSHSTFIGPDGLSLEEARALQDKLLAGLSTSPIDDKINAAARLMLEGRHQDCMQAYAAIAAEHPEKRGTAEGQIGACQFFLGNFEQAIAHYEKAKELGEDAFNAVDAQGISTDFVVLEASGHSLMVNQPVTFAEEIITFVDTWGVPR